ncbi:MAG: ammonium transporter [Bacteroidales bacterium]
MINNGDVAFMVIATVLVFFMIPGLAFFYGGLVERKNSLTMMYYTFISIGIVTIMWCLGGFSLVFGRDMGGIIGNPAEYFMFRGVDFTINPQYGSKIPFLMFFMYQLMFAIITAPLMTGAFANRMTIAGWIKLLIPWMIFIYFPVAHWVWGGGFLAQMGFVDYAGGTVIHVTAAFAALAAIILLGKRAVTCPKKCMNLNMVLIGSAILFFGWFGFNSGGALASGETAAIAFTNTGVAAGFATIAWVILDYIRNKRISFVETLTGTVAGLATITPCSGYVLPQAAALIGIIGAAVCYFSVMLIHKLKLDDALDVFGVHGMGGFTGTVLIGIFAVAVVNSINFGIQQLLIQLLGVVLVAIYSFVVTWIILKLIKATGSLHVDAEIQQKGLDSVFIEEAKEEAKEEE